MPDQLFSPHQPTELEKAMEDLRKRIAGIRAGQSQPAQPSIDLIRGENVYKQDLDKLADHLINDFPPLPKLEERAYTHAGATVGPKPEMGGIFNVPNKIMEGVRSMAGIDTTGRRNFLQESVGGLSEIGKGAIALPAFFGQVIEKIGLSGINIAKGQGFGEAVQNANEAVAKTWQWLEPYDEAGKMTHALVASAEMFALGGLPAAKGIVAAAGQPVSAFSAPAAHSAQSAMMGLSFGLISEGIQKGSALGAKAFTKDPKKQQEIAAILQLGIEAAFVVGMGKGQLDAYNMRRVGQGLPPRFRDTPEARRLVKATRNIASKVAKGKQVDAWQELQDLGFPVRTLKEVKLAEEAVRYPEAYRESPGLMEEAPEIYTETKAGKPVTVTVNVPGMRKPIDISVIPGAKPVEAAPAPAAEAAPAPAAPGVTKTKAELLKGAGLKPKPIEVKTAAPKAGQRDVTDPTTGIKRRIASRKGDSWGPDNTIRINPKEAEIAFNDQSGLNRDMPYKDGTVRHALNVQFKTFDEFIDFIARHELAHGLPEFSLKNFEGIGPMEDAINKAVLGGLRPEQTDLLIKFFKKEVARYKAGKWKPNAGFVSNPEAAKFYAETEGKAKFEEVPGESAGVEEVETEIGPDTVLEGEAPTPPPTKPAAIQIAEHVAAERVKLKELLDQGKISKEGYDVLMAELDETEKVGQKFAKPAPPPPAKPAPPVAAKPAVRPGQVIVKKGTIDRAAVVSNPNAVYLLQDNLRAEGKRGQAGRIGRDEPNVVGIPVKRHGSMEDSAFFTDADFNAVKAEYDRIFAGLPKDKDIVVPANLASGGTGPKLKTTAPKIHQYLLDKIEALKRERGTWQVQREGKVKTAKEPRTAAAKAAKETDWVARTAKIGRDLVSYPMDPSLLAAKAEAEARLGNVDVAKQYLDAAYKHREAGDHFTEPNIARAEKAIAEARPKPTKPAPTEEEFPVFEGEGEEIGPEWELEGTVEGPEMAPGRPVEGKTQAPPTGGKGRISEAEANAKLRSGEWGREEYEKWVGESAPTKGAKDVKGAFEDIDEMAWVDWKTDKDPQLRKIAEEIEGKDDAVYKITGQRPTERLKFTEEESHITPMATFKRNKAGEIITEKGVVKDPIVERQLKDLVAEKRLTKEQAAEISKEHETENPFAGLPKTYKKKVVEGGAVKDAPLSEAERVTVSSLTDDISRLMAEGLRREKAVYGAVRASVYPGAKTKEQTWLSKEEWERIKREAVPVESREIPEGWKQPYPREGEATAPPAESRIVPGQPILVKPGAADAAIGLADRFFSKIDAQGPTAIERFNQRYGITTEEMKAVTSAFGNEATRTMRDILAKQNAEGRLGQFTDAEAREFLREYGQLRDSLSRDSRSSIVQEEAAGTYYEKGFKTAKPSRGEGAVPEAESPVRYSGAEEEIPMEAAEAKETARKKGQLKRGEARYKEDQFGPTINEAMTPIIEAKAREHAIRDNPRMDPKETAHLVRGYSNKIWLNWNRKAAEGTLIGLDQVKRYAAEVEAGRATKEAFHNWLRDESQFGNNLKGYSYASAKGGERSFMFGKEMPESIAHQRVLSMLKRQGIDLAPPVGTELEILEHNKMALLFNEVRSSLDAVLWGEESTRGTRSGGMVEEFIKETARKYRGGMDLLVKERTEVLRRYAETMNENLVASETLVPRETVRNIIDNFHTYAMENVDRLLKDAEAVARERHGIAISDPEVQTLFKQLGEKTKIPSFETMYYHTMEPLIRYANAKSGNVGLAADAAIKNAKVEAAKLARDKWLREKGVEPGEIRGVRERERTTPKVEDEAIPEEEWVNPEEWVGKGEPLSGEPGDVGMYDDYDIAGFDAIRDYLRSPKEKAKRRREKAGVWRPSPEATEAIEGATEGTFNKTFREKMSGYGKAIKSDIARVFRHLNPKNPADAIAIDALVHHRDNIFHAQDWAARAIGGEVTKIFDKARGDTKTRTYDTFNQYIWMRDHQRQAIMAFQEGREYKSPYFKDAEGVMEAFESLESYIDGLKPFEQEIVGRAVRARDAAFRAVQNELIYWANRVGYKGIEKLFDNPDYFRHEVINYYEKANEKSIVKTARHLGINTRSWAQRRLAGGHTMPWNLDVAKVDAHILSRLFYEKEALKLLSTIKENYDIWPEYKAQFLEPGADRESFIKHLEKNGWTAPDGTEYTVMWPGRKNFYYHAKAISERFARDLAKRNFEELLKEGGLEGMWDDILAVGRRENPIMIPKQIKGAIEEFSRSTGESGIGVIAGTTTMHEWKRWMLHGPPGYIKYSLRNLSGDLDAAIAGNPRAIKRLFTDRVAKDVYHYVTGEFGKVSNPLLKEYMDNYGFGNSFHRTEFSQMQKLMSLDAAFRNLPKTATFVPDAVRGVWKKWFSWADKVADLREGILRAANYLEYYDQIMKNNAAGKGMVPDNYGASNRSFINGLTDPKKMAYHLSNDLMGAYNMVSEFGQHMRSGPIPFWSWKEITMKRYWNLAKNAWVDGKTAAGIGKNFIKASPFIAKKVGMFAIKANLLMSAIDTFNNLLYPGDEENLPQDVKKGPHILLGNNRYFPGIGGSNDVYEFFGLETPQEMVRDLVSGQFNLRQIAQRFAQDKPMVNYMFQSINPFAKLGMELVTKRKLYPNMFEPRGIRDPYEHIANTFRLGDIYRSAFDRPGRQKDYLKLLRNMVDYEHDPYETAYFDWLKRVNDYKKTKGAQTVGYSITPKSNYLYYFKRARLEGDMDAAQRYFKKWMVAAFQEGGLRGKSSDEITKGLAQSLKQSYRVMNPLYHLTDFEKAELASQLTEDEKRMLAMAMGYWTNILVGAEDAAHLLGEEED